MAIRTFRDSEGTSWRVWRVIPQNEVLLSSSPAMARGWLCFESVGEKRRLTDPPEEWDTASETVLMELLARASAVRRAVTAAGD